MDKRAKMETPKRTLVKAVVWMAVGLVMMALVGLLFTGSVAVGGLMALVNSAIGFVSYMAYERLWSRISWGRVTG